MDLTFRQRIAFSALTVVGLATAVAAAFGVWNAAGVGFALLATVAALSVMDVRRRQGDLAAQLKAMTARLKAMTESISARQQQLASDTKRTQQMIEEAASDRAQIQALEAARDRLDTIGETLTTGLAMERIAAAERHAEVTDGLASISAAKEAAGAQHDLIGRATAAEHDTV